MPATDPVTKSISKPRKRSSKRDRPEFSLSSRKASPGGAQQQQQCPQRCPDQLPAQQRLRGGRRGVREGDKDWQPVLRRTMLGRLPHPENPTRTAIGIHSGLAKTNLAWRKTCWRGENNAGVAKTILAWLRSSRPSGGLASRRGQTRRPCVPALLGGETPLRRQLPWLIPVR